MGKKKLKQIAYNVLQLYEVKVANTKLKYLQELQPLLFCIGAVMCLVLKRKKEGEKKV